MIAFAVGILTAMILLFALITYLWFTRTDPGRHRIPGLTDDDTYPYPPLSPFPAPEPAGDYGCRKRLATTSELRALAYDGDLETINSEVAAWKALLLLDDWTTAA